MKVACLLAPHLPVQVEQQLDPSLPLGPLVVGGRPWDPGVVVDCCPQATAAGVTLGMRLAQAEKLCPQARFISAHESDYEAGHQALIVAARAFTDRIETASLGHLYLDITGLKRRYGSAQRLARDLVREAKRASRFTVQVGVGNNKFIAEQAACAAPADGECVVLSNETSLFLSTLPLSALPTLDLEMEHRLHMLGIRTLGTLAALPRPAIVRQFGSQAGSLHDLASGFDVRPVRPDAPPLVVERRRPLAEPLGERGPLLAHVSQIATELAQALAGSGLQGEKLRLDLEVESGSMHAAGATVKPPSADAGQLARLAARLLEQLAPDQPVVAISLVAYPVRPFHLGSTQLAMFRAALDRPLELVREARSERLREALRQLRERFGDLIIRIAALVGSPPPQSVHITTDTRGMPSAIAWADRIQEVPLVHEAWRVRTEWWKQPIERDYFRVETADEQVRVVFYDLRARQWWLERRRI